MFKKPTVFILGAGASLECGFPLGMDLKEQIANDLRFRFDYGSSRPISGDPNLLEIFRQHFRKDINIITQAANELASSMTTFNSIDDALNYFSKKDHLVLLGKAGIIFRILHAERHSYLRNEPNTGSPNLGNIGNTWYRHFLSMAITGVPHSEIGSVFNSLTFINFNYDRSLEHYLYWALQEQAAIDQQTAINLVSNLRVIRPYGSVGPLNWQGSDGTQYGGPDYLGTNLFSLAKGIRTYTEQHENQISEQIDMVLNQAELIILIGFGFHEANMKLLRKHPQNYRMKGQKVFATVKGIAEENHEHIARQLRNCFNAGNDRTFYDRTGNALLGDLRLSISAATDTNGL